MRLDIGTFPVEDIRFGSRTRWKDGSPGWAKGKKLAMNSI